MRHALSDQTAPARTPVSFECLAHASILVWAVGRRSGPVPIQFERTVLWSAEARRPALLGHQEGRIEFTRGVVHRHDEVLGRLAF